MQMKRTTTSISKDTRCSFIKPSGDRCGAARVRDSGYCYFHSPTCQEERHAARVRGGLARHATGEPGDYRIESPADILVILERAVNDCFAQAPTLGRAKTLAQICSVLLKGMEVVEFESRLRVLEQAVFKAIEDKR